ncbi:MAG: hypothetical protein QM621_14705 [Aeromicrobium sp.]|uniref:hypothetical protein n=1 Tax=Aeromicrobium sp. TaxID=1871063 RepID=UPI0039E298A5
MATTTSDRFFEPLTLPGGVVRLQAAEEVLAGGVALVGLGSALAVDPDLPNRWRDDPVAAVRLTPVRIADKTVASAAGMARVRQQLRRLGRGRSTRPSTSPKTALAVETLLQRLALRRHRRWLATR